MRAAGNGKIVTAKIVCTLGLGSVLESLYFGLRH
jgi:hypothetical protein